MVNNQECQVMCKKVFALLLVTFHVFLWLTIQSYDHFGQILKILQCSIPHKMHPRFPPNIDLGPPYTMMHWGTARDFFVLLIMAGNAKESNIDNNNNTDDILIIM